MRLGHLKADERRQDRGWQPIEAVAPIIKMLVVDAALKGLITAAAATKVVSSDWLRNA